MSPFETSSPALQSLFFLTRVKQALHHPPHPPTFWEAEPQLPPLGFSGPVGHPPATPFQDLSAGPEAALCLSTCHEEAAWGGAQVDG